MKYFIRPLDPAKATFADNDIFGRRAFGEHLMTIVQEHHDFELVIGLDAQWGDGKTVFIRQWEHMLTQKEKFNHVFYYDAFAHDYYDEPLVPFIAEINQFFSTKKIDVKELCNTALDGLSCAAKIMTIADPTTAVLSAVSGEVIGGTKNLLNRFIDIKSKNKDALNTFREDIKKISSLNENKNKPIVFIIDELDRCKPSYAIKLLEVIKHLFSVPGIVFVLVLNSQQLRESIKHEYGNGIDAALYMNKFINLWLSLPKDTSTQSLSDNSRYIDHCFYELELLNSDLTSHRFKIFADIYNLSFREIEKILTQYKLITNVYAKNRQANASIAILYVIIIKVINPKLFDSILNQKATYEELSTNVINRFAHADTDIYRELRNIFRIYSENGVPEIINNHGLNKGGSTNSEDEAYIKNNFDAIKSAPTFLTNFRI